MSAQLRARDAAVPSFDHASFDTQQRLDDALSRINTLQIERAVLEQRLALLAQTTAATHRLAYYDELTGLPNRRLLADRFRRAAARAARHSYQIAVLVLDLDGFKLINDTLGHSEGDKLLQRVAVRLACAVRASDTACRLGGDEFLVLLEEVDEQSALGAAAKIRAQLSVPYLIGDSTIEITTSVGTAVFPLAGEQYESLMRRADLAMYHDKARAPTPPTISKGLPHESSAWRVA
jgi:diguanylate cyclase (GGDEF)-like protein